MVVLIVALNLYGLLKHESLNNILYEISSIFDSMILLWSEF